MYFPSIRNKPQDTGKSCGSIYFYLLWFLLLFLLKYWSKLKTELKVPAATHILSYCIRSLSINVAMDLVWPIDGTLPITKPMYFKTNSPFACLPLAYGIDILDGMITGNVMFKTIFNISIILFFAIFYSTYARKV